MLAASTINPEERLFVVVRSKHAHGQQERPEQSRIEIVRILKNPITVVTANCEVHPKEEAAVNVRVLDGQGDGVPKARPKQTAADSRGSRTCVCANTFGDGVSHAGEEG